MRRRIGQAFERSPAEQVGRWLRDNLIRLVGSAIAVTLFCLAVNWLAGSLLNFLANNGDDTAKRAIATDDPAVVGVKIVGGVVLTWFMMFRLRMRSSGL